MEFNFKEGYVLENECVALRPLQLSDYDLLLEYAVNEPDIWSFNARGADSPDNLRKYIENAMQQRANEREYPFIVYDKKSGKYVGSTRFYDVLPFNRILEIGYTWYGKAYQGTVVNKSCKYLLLQFAFERLKAERVGFRANNKNEKSKNAMKSIGCKEEGVLRNFNFGANGERIDVVMLSIIKDQWAAVKEQLIKAIELKKLA